MDRAASEDAMDIDVLSQPRRRPATFSAPSSAGAVWTGQSGAGFAVPDVRCENAMVS